MAAFSGKQATATFSGLTIEMASWSISATADTAEVTVTDASAPAADKHWKDHIATYKDWTATVDGVLPLAGVGLSALGDEQTLTIDCTVTGGRIYSGTAICTGINPSGEAQDAGRVSMSFQGVAQLAETAT